MGKVREALGYYRRSYNIDNGYGSALACVLQVCSVRPLGTGDSLGVVREHNNLSRETV